MLSGRHDQELLSLLPLEIIGIDYGCVDPSRYVKKKCCAGFRFRLRKTYIACALGHQACLKSYSVRYYRLPRLILALTQANADGDYSRLLKAIASLDVLIIGDWGLEPLNAATRNDFMEIMDDRYEQSVTVIISQLPTEQWYESIGDNTLADAILDRLMHNAHRMNLKGESMRKKMNSLTQVEHLE